MNSKQNDINSEQSSQYQDQILKVKKIWNDIKQCDKQTKKTYKKGKNNHNQTKSYKDVKKSNKFNNQGQNIKQRQKITYNKTNQNKVSSKQSGNQKDTIQFSTIRQQLANSKGYQKQSSKRQLHESTSCYNLSSQKKKHDEALFKKSEGKQNTFSHQQQNCSFGRNYPQQIYQLNKQIQSMNQQLSLLRVYNHRYKDVVNRLEKQLRQKDEMIKKLNLRQQELLATTYKKGFHKKQDDPIVVNCSRGVKNQNNNVYESLNNNIVEYQHYKKDCKRLLKMLKCTSEYQDFAALAIEDGNVRFLHQMNKIRKSNIDMISLRNLNVNNQSSSQIRDSKGKSKLQLRENSKENNMNVHFCSCNKEYLPLKQEQMNLWVPQKIYEYGKKFILQKKGEQIGQNQMELILYEMNRMWRQREKRLINRYKGQNASKIRQMERRMNGLLNNGSKNIQKQYNE